LGSAYCAREHIACQSAAADVTAADVTAGVGTSEFGGQWSFLIHAWTFVLSRARTVVPTNTPSTTATVPVSCHAAVAVFAIGHTHVVTRKLQVVMAILLVLMLMVVLVVVR
jgi:hypothetical protein